MLCNALAWPDFTGHAVLFIWMTSLSSVVQSFKQVKGSIFSAKTVVLVIYARTMCMHYVALYDYVMVRMGRSESKN